MTYEMIDILEKTIVEIKCSFNEENLTFNEVF